MTYKKISETENEYNVQAILEKLGGGGHLNASGCKIFGTFEEVKEKLPEDGSVILCNHTMALDPFMIGAKFNKPIYFMTSKDQPTVFKKANSPIDKSLFVDKLMYARLNVQSILKMKLNGEKVGAELKKECKRELDSDLGGAVYKSIENIDYIEMEVVNEGKTMNLSAVMIDQDKTPIEFVLNELMRRKQNYRRVGGIYPKLHRRF